MTRGLAKEGTAWKGREGPLLPLERRRYLEAMTRTTLAGLDEARAAPAGVVKWLERGRG